MNTGNKFLEKGKNLEDIINDDKRKVLDIAEAIPVMTPITNEERENVKDEFLKRKGLMESAIAGLSKGKNLRNVHNVELLKTLRMAYKLMFLSIDNYILLSREVKVIDTQLETIDWTNAEKIARKNF